MKTLLAIYRAFVLLHICPPDKTISRWMKLLNILLFVMCPLTSFIVVAGSFIYFIKYFSIDLANAIGACFQICGQGTTCCSFLIAYVKRNDLEKIFNIIQQFFDASK